MVSADKMPPVEAIKEGHTEKDGDSEVAPTSRDNPTVAQGKGTMVALVGWVPSSSGHCLAEALSGANVSCFLLSFLCCTLCLTAPLLSDSDVPEQTKLPTAESMCHCDTCGRRHVSDGAREGRGFCSEHCHQQFKER